MEEVKQQAPKEVKAAKAASKPIPVRIIQENGPTALVEWTVKDDARRAYIPKEVIHDLRVEVAELDAGIPYGVRWEELAVVTATPERIGQQLRRRNIWTVRDFERRVNEAQAAFLEAMGADFGALMQKARQLEEDK